MVRRLAVLLAAIAILAGILGGGSPAGAVGAFGAPLVVSGLDDNEPSIDVAADGTIYINAIGGIFIPGPSPSHLWRSTNGGTSFTLTPAGARGLFPGGGDSDVALDPATGTIYWSDLWLGDSTVAVSSDKGASWIAQPLGGPPVQDRQWQATPGGGRVYIVTNQIAGGLVVSHSLDGGLTYLPGTTAATLADRGNCICPPGTIIAQGSSAISDRVGVIHYTATGGVKFARSTNGGLTWANVVVQGNTSFDTTAGFPVVAAGAGDTLHAVWMELVPGGKKGVGATAQIKYASSSNWGASWSAPKVIVAGGNAGTPLYPWVAARGSKVGVSLFHTAAGPYQPGNVPASALWYEKYLESTDGGATFSGLATVDSQAVKSGPICLDGFFCGSDRELGDFQALTLDAAGRAHLTWTRLVGGDTDTEIRYVRQL